MAGAENAPDGDVPHSSHRMPQWLPQWPIFKNSKLADWLMITATVMAAIAAIESAQAARGQVAATFTSQLFVQQIIQISALSAGADKQATILKSYMNDLDYEIESRDKRNDSIKQFSMDQSIATIDKIYYEIEQYDEVGDQTMIVIPDQLKNSLYPIGNESRILKELFSSYRMACLRQLRVSSGRCKVKLRVLDDKIDEYLRVVQIGSGRIYDCANRVFQNGEFLSKHSIGICNLNDT